MRSLRIAVAGAGLILLAGVALWLMPLVFGPALPAGAARLHITTAGPGITLGCPAALLAPVRVATAGDELVLINVESGQTVRVVWPAGFGAWRVDGRAVVANPLGGVIAREGDVLDDLGGGLGAGDLFHICPLGL
jgi:hypothetical protein